MEELYYVKSFRPIKEVEKIKPDRSDDEIT